MSHRLGLFLAVGACTLDLILWGVTAAPFPYFSRGTFYALIGTNASLGALGLACCMALIPHFMVSGALGADLLVMIPMGAAFYYMRSIADIPKVLLVLLVGCSVLVHSFFF